MMIEQNPRGNGRELPGGLAFPPTATHRGLSSVSCFDCIQESMSSFSHPSDDGGKRIQNIVTDKVGNL